MASERKTSGTWGGFGVVASSVMLGTLAAGIVATACLELTPRVEPTADAAVAPTPLDAGGDVAVDSATPSTCANGVKDGFESDVDCGGNCAPCDVGKACTIPPECKSGSCDPATRVCVASSCNDFVRNGTESDVDCGGSCPQKCPPSAKCNTSADCDRSICQAGAQVCVPPQTCAQLLAAFPGSPSGLYVMDPDGLVGDPPFPVLCDMTTVGGGWTSVFKIGAGSAADAAALWSAGTPVNDATPDCATPASAGPASFCMNAFATKYWNANGVAFTSARVNAYVGGAIAAFLSFSGLTADRIGWFTPARLASSTWGDLAAGPTSFFSITGDATNGRNWFVSSTSGNCATDTGWFVVSSTGGATPKSCSWELDRGPNNRILFSSQTTAADWNNAVVTGSADVMMIFVR